MQRPRHEASPGKYRRSQEGKEGAHTNEDGAIGQIRLLHEGCTGSIGNLRVWGTNTGERRESSQRDDAVC